MAADEPPSLAGSLSGRIVTVQAASKAFRMLTAILLMGPIALPSLAATRPPRSAPLVLRRIEAVPGSRFRRGSRYRTGSGSPTARPSLALVERSSLGSRVPIAWYSTSRRDSDRQAALAGP